MSNQPELPTLFVSHGAPDVLLSTGESASALRQLPHYFAEPRAIVVVSAHWIDELVGITQSENLKTIHDFGGFAPELYQMHYSAKGDANLSLRISQLLNAQGVNNKLDVDRGLDHGAWIPLMMMYPDAHIPIVQVSLPLNSLEKLDQIGKALAPLKEEGVLIMASGGSVHNLRAVNREGRTEAWAQAFEEWLCNMIENNRFDNLINAQQFPESFHIAHPTIEHYAPLIVAWAAADTTKPGKRLHHSFMYGNIGMSHYSFG